MSEALYRKYRPQSFDEIHGQHHVKRILSNALENDEVAHAYLFTGPHGTGKTSIARILAKELKVEGVDLIEIDAASHRGIDDVREIRESVGFKPSQSPVKLYILDEAHMLTNEAFNALLKTIEEPPEHVYFVLCTTEAHKIPLTIASRCQRLVFQPAQADDVKSYLQHVAEKESLVIPDESLDIIIENTKGSYRDAMVTLAQAMRYVEGQELQPEVLEKEVGLVSSSTVSVLLGKIIQKDRLGFVEYINSGVSGSAAIVALTNKLVELAALALSFPEKYNKFSNTVESRDIVTLIESLTEARRRMSYTDDASVPLLVAVLKWMDGGDDRNTKSENKPGQVEKTSNTKGEKSEIKKKSLKVNEEVDPETSVSVEVTEEKETVEATVETKTVERDTQKEQESGNSGSTTMPDASDFRSQWDKIMAEIKSQKRSVEALLKAAEVDGVGDNDELILQFAYAFHKNKIEETENRQIVEQVIEEHIGRKITIRCVLGNDQPNAKAEPQRVKKNDTVTEVDSENKNKASHKDKTESFDHSHDLGDIVVEDEDLIKKAQEVLGGQLIE